MRQFGKFFLVSVLSATISANFSPVFAQTNDVSAAPVTPDRSAPESPAQQPKTIVPGAPPMHETATAKPPVVHIAPHKAKKKTHKSSSKHTKKANPQKPALHKTKHPAKKTVSKKATPKTSRRAAVKSAPLAPVPAHIESPKLTPAAVEKNAGNVKLPQNPNANAIPPKDVTYDLCVGYDNCVPHLYEVRSTANGTETKIFKRSANGKWEPAKIDPVMAAELGRMAKNEAPGRTERALTEDEKARIAGRQGKTHAELMGEVKANNISRVKDIFRDMDIRTLYDLDAYDPRLRQNEVAITAVNELAIERAKNGGGIAP